MVAGRGDRATAGPRRAGTARQTREPQPACVLKCKGFSPATCSVVVVVLFFLKRAHFRLFSFAPMFLLDSLAALAIAALEKNGGFKKAFVLFFFF